MGRTVMSGRNIQLKGLDLFVYLMERFGNTPEQALAEMKEHGQDIKDAELFVKMYNKQKGNKNEDSISKS